MVMIFNTVVEKKEHVKDGLGFEPITASNILVDGPCLHICVEIGTNSNMFSGNR